MRYPSDRREDLQRLFQTAGLVLLLSLALFSYLWRNIQMSNIRYDVEKLRKERRKLYLSLESMTLRFASKSTVSRIDELIREKYGYLPVNYSQKVTTLRIRDLPNAGKEGETSKKP